MTTRVRVAVGEVSSHFQAVEFRQHQVEHQDIRLVAFDLSNRFHPR